MKRSSIQSVASHLFVAALMTFLVGNLCTVTHTHEHHPTGDLGLLQSLPNGAQPPKEDQPPKEVATDVKESSVVIKQEEEKPKKLLSSRIDFSACPAHERLTICPKVNYLVGMGHKTTEAMWFLWFALTRGYCYCFSPENFGDDAEIYHLLLEPLLPKCDDTKTLQKTTVKGLANDKFDFNKEIAWIQPDAGEVWPQAQRARPPGFGDTMAFIDHFLQDNRIIQERLYPHYLEKKTIDSAFRKSSDDENNIITAAFHLRVGDVVLEAKEEYWRNVLQSLRGIVDMEHGSSKKIEVYWMYFQAIFRGGQGNAMRSKLGANEIGQWPSEESMLPNSHTFLSKLCNEIPNFECLWKYGTNILESIDLFVEADVVYASGSSFSQALSLFQRKEHGIKLFALPKELNYWGKADKGSVPFLQTHTGAFTNLRYYYLDGTGEVFPEQLAHLKWNGLPRSSGNTTTD